MLNVTLKPIFCSLLLLTTERPITLETVRYILIDSYDYETVSCCYI